MRNIHFLYRCAKQRHQLAKSRLERDRETQEKECKRKSLELKKKKTQAELGFSKKKCWIETGRKSDKQIMKIELERLATKMKVTIATFDEELKDNEIIWMEYAGLCER